MLKNKKAIFIDMGNTLLDFHKGLSDDEKDRMGLKAMQINLLSLGHVVSVKALEKSFLQGINNYQHLRLSTLLEQDVMALLDNFGDFSDQEKIGLLKAFYSPYKSAVVINPGAKAFLESLKAKELYVGIVSNCYLPSVLYREIFEHLELAHLIDAYTFSYDVKYRKPKAQIFMKALEKAALPVDRCLMIGDALKADVLGASLVGIDSIWYNPNKLAKTCESPYLKGVIEAFSELIY